MLRHPAVISSAQRPSDLRRRHSLQRWIGALAIAHLMAAPSWSQTPGKGKGEPGLGGSSTTVTLGAMKDNTLYETQNGELSNGAGLFIFAGRTNQALRRRALLAFDIAAAIPAPAIIEEVQLRLEMNRTFAGNIDVRLLPMESDWGEGTSDAEGQEGIGTSSTTGDATWLHSFFDTAIWSTPGGDFGSLSSATQTVADFNFYTWGSTPEMVADVQGWLDDPATNYGWILLGDETANRTVKRFASRENTAPTTRPALIITYRSDDLLFSDGFESGDAGVWSSQVP